MSEKKTLYATMILDKNEKCVKILGNLRKNETLKSDERLSWTSFWADFGLVTEVHFEGEVLSG